MKKLVLLGGGHSQIEVLRRFAMAPVEGLSIALVTRELMAPYSGMLPGFIAGHYTHREAHIDLRALAAAAGARVIFAEATGIDPEAKRVLFDDRPPLSYDVLSINIGSRPEMADVPGAREYALPAKPVDEFIEGWERVMEEAFAAEKGYTITIVGAGAGGCELALTMQYHLKKVHVERFGDTREFGVRLNVVTDGNRILPTHNDGVRNRVTRLLYKRGVHTHLNMRVVEVTANELIMDTDERIGYDALIWVTNASAPAWLKHSGLHTNDEGFLLIDTRLRSLSHEDVFAAGDIASSTKYPRPKSGVFAVRQGPFLADNLRAALTGGELKQFKPQEKFLSLIGTGNKAAIASRGERFSAQGSLIWMWKDYIDRKFMNMYGPMVGEMAEDVNGDAMNREMHCAGCGSKVGATVLRGALERLRESAGEAAERITFGDDAAVLEFPTGKKVVATVDHFKAFVEDPYLLGRITANHCLSDVYAMGATPHSVLATVTLPHSLASAHDDVLYELLAGTFAELEADGASLVGGHTAQGEEFFYGLTVNGVLEGVPLAKTGARIGDALILTKAIGTGTILAGDMQRLTQNVWLHGAMDSMLESNREAARIFRQFNANALTDVTGFGLVGHLLEMLGEELAADLKLDDVPLLHGALRLAQEGVRSTLYPENHLASERVHNATEYRTDPRYPLLFDPQTSGGLLAAVPIEDAEYCLKALQEVVSTPCAIIGYVTKAEHIPGMIVLS